MTSPLVIVMPTRGRPNDAREATQSLLDTAVKVQPTQLQAYWLVDEDDPALGDYQSHKLLTTCGLHISKGRDGYAELPARVWQILRARAFSWTVFWNDDARMKTKGWDEIVRAHDGHLGPWVISPRQLPPCNTRIPTFPFVSRPFLQALGCFSEHPLTDNYLCSVAKRLDGFAWLEGVKVEHRHRSLKPVAAWDETSKRAVGIPRNLDKEIHSPEYAALIDAAAERVRRQFRVYL
jgi:hypothetical protein